MSVLETIKELVSIPSHSGDTGQIEEYVASKVREIAEVDFVPAGDKGRCVVAGVIHDESLPTIVVNGHLDTVKACEGWTREPLRATVDGDRLFGLGSADMKGGVAVAIEVFRMLAALGTVNVTFAGTIDEEGDSSGAFAVLDSGVKGDLCIITEPSNGNIMLGCRGRLAFEILVQGVSAHGAVPEKGVNAIEEASKFVISLQDLKLAEHEILGKGSVCVLEISGGTSTLSVPEKCRLRLDRHYVPDETKEGIVKALMEKAAGLGSDASFEIRPDPNRQTPFLEPYITPRTELVEKFLDVIGGGVAYGKSVGDYNAFATRMPTVVFGPTGADWHCADEWVSISSVEACLKKYRAFSDSLSKLPAPEETSV